MKFWRDVFLQNWGVKLTSVFLAFFLWMAMRGEPPAERVITVPLEIIRPAEMEITGERPSTVELTLRGATSNMWPAQPVPSCRIDLQDASEGEHVVSLTQANVRLPRASGLEVVAIRPARVKLVLERTITRTVPVEVSRGDPPLDLEVYAVTVTPPTVVITGPRTRVQAIREVSTESISLAGRRESFRTPARLTAEDGSILMTPPGPVDVYFQIGARRQLQTITNVPVVSEDPSFTLSPSTVALSVLVPISVPRKLTPGDFTASVAAVDLDPTKAILHVRPEVTLKKEIASGIVIMQVKPPEVTVRKTADN
ncbi:MAG: hypothetical protein HXY20_07540 [Acidobacteria bacterium]|nr:hypothetical protein [Acidobacteriota bacterium]